MVLTLDGRALQPLKSGASRRMGRQLPDKIRHNEAGKEAEIPAKVAVSLVHRCITNALLYQLSYCGSAWKISAFALFLPCGTHYTRWWFLRAFALCQTDAAYKIRHTQRTVNSLAPHHCPVRHFALGDLHGC
jgi:hypothetical protein